MRSLLPILLVLVPGLAACAGDEPAAPPAAIDTTPQAPIRTAEGGVEVRAILAPDSRQVALALERHAAQARPLSIDAGVRRALEGCGLRLVAFPVHDAVAVERALMAGDRPASRATRWIESGPLWAEAVREPGSDQERPVALHDSRLLLRAGYLRLLARAWLEPTARPGPSGTRMGAAARIELAPQIVEARSDHDWGRSLRTPTARGLEEQGQVLTRLRASLALDPDQAVALVFEEPGADWSRLLAEPPAPPSPPQPAAPLAPDAASPRLGQVTRGPVPAPPQPPAAADGPAQPAAGPPVFRTRTLGEVLLAGAAPPGRHASKARVVLLIIPRMRDETWLLGRPSPGSSAPDPAAR